MGSEAVKRFVNGFLRGGKAAAGARTRYNKDGSVNKDELITAVRGIPNTYLKYQKIEITRLSSGPTANAEASRLRQKGGAARPAATCTLQLERAQGAPRVSVLVVPSDRFGPGGARGAIAYVGCDTSSD
eukprot:scaffold32834_cov63-Phaeocystis_antarctica.AAC.1